MDFVVDRCGALAEIIIIRCRASTARISSSASWPDISGQAEGHQHGIGPMLSDLLDGS